VAELKTKPTQVPVGKFIASIKDDDTRKDCLALAKMMTQVTGAKPKMWGSAIVSFRSCHLRYASGRNGLVLQASPPGQNLTLYTSRAASRSTEPCSRSWASTAPYRRGLRSAVRQLDDASSTLKKLIQQSVKDATKLQEVFLGTSRHHPMPNRGHQAVSSMRPPIHMRSRRGAQAADLPGSTRGMDIAPGKIIPQTYEAAVAEDQRSRASARSPAALYFRRSHP
jgi:hypothetical protein